MTFYIMSLYTYTCICSSITYSPQSKRSFFLFLFHKTTKQSSHIICLQCGHPKCYQGGAYKCGKTSNDVKIYQGLTKMKLISTSCGDIVGNANFPHIYVYTVSSVLARQSTHSLMEETPLLANIMNGMCGSLIILAKYMTSKSLVVHQYIVKQ